METQQLLTLKRFEKPMYGVSSTLQNETMKAIKPYSDIIGAVNSTGFLPAKNYRSYLADKVPGLTFAVLRRNHKTGQILENMANHSATKKDVRQAAKRRERNKFYGKTTRNAIRDFRAASGKEASDKLPAVASMIDKLAKRGIIHKNKAANLKSKLARKAAAK